MYKKLIDPVSGQDHTGLVFRLSDHTYVPFDPANNDYQEYLKWFAEGNTPLPADAQGAI